MVDVDAPPAGSLPERRRSLALGLAAASVVAALAATVLWAQLVVRPLDRVPTASIMIALAGGIAPLLAVASVVLMLRMRGTVSQAGAVRLLVVASLALPLAALAGVSWGLGFADADAGRPITGLAAATAPLLLAALLTSAALVGLLVHAVALHSGLGEAGAGGLAVVCGLLGGPIVVFGLSAPPTSAGLAVGALLLVAFTWPRTAVVELAAGSTPSGVAPSAELVAPLARLALGAGVLGLAVAVSGATWWPTPIDATRAMVIGISILLAAGLPLTAAAARLAAVRFPRIGPLVRGPATALALALSGVGLAYAAAPEGWAGGIAIASLLLGVAVGGMSFVLPLPRRIAVVVGLAVALSLAATQAATLLAALAFAVPLLAAGVLVLAARAPGRARVTEWPEQRD